MRRKELISRIEALEMNNYALGKELLALKEKHLSLMQAFDFAVGSNNNDLKFHLDTYTLQITLCYLRSSRFVEVGTPFIWFEKDNVHIVENDDKFAVIKRDMENGEAEYYTLDKAKKCLTKNCEV